MEGRSWQKCANHNINLWGKSLDFLNKISSIAQKNLKHGVLTAWTFTIAQKMALIP